MSLFLNLQLTWDLHPNSLQVQGNITQESEQARGKLHLYFKALAIMRGQHSLSKPFAAPLPFLTLCLLSITMSVIGRFTRAGQRQCIGFKNSFMYTETGICMQTHTPFKAGKHIRIKCWLRLHIPMQTEQIQSLVGELRFHMPQGQKTKTFKKKKKKTRNNIVINSKNTLKMFHIKKIFLRKATLLMPFSCHFLS